MAKARVRTDARRSSELRQMLQQRRTTLAAQLKEKMRAVRAADGVDRGVREPHEAIDGDGQSEIVLSLLQAESETLRLIDAALQRLERRTYGDCSQCGGVIPTERLRALPFATRCKPCEEAREQTSALSRRRAAADEWTRD